MLEAVRMPSSETAPTFEKPQWAPPSEDAGNGKLKKKFMEEPFVPIGKYSCKIMTDIISANSRIIEIWIDTASKNSCL